MTRVFLFGLMLALASFSGLRAQQPAPDFGALIDRAIEDHILPGFALFDARAADLHTASSGCGGDEAALRGAYHSAFDAWVGIAHLRFGPTEENNAAFALAYWPDPKGHTPRSLRSLVQNRDNVVNDPAAFSEVSIAARGFFALERLLFDPGFADPAGGYRCRLLGAITGDMSALAAGMDEAWRTDYASRLRNPGDQTDFATEKEVVQALYSHLNTSAEFTLSARLHRPLGKDDRPRPKRAEAWRSGRSNRNIQLTLVALETMFEDVFAAAMPERAAVILRSEFYTIRRIADALPNPLDVMVADPYDRRKVVHLGFAFEELLRRFDGLVRPSLGLSLTFNALDGD